VPNSFCYQGTGTDAHLATGTYCRYR